MKAIINEKLYDTETAESIYSFLRRVDKGHRPWLPQGYSYMPQHEFTLYRTAKGNYFTHDTEDNVLEAITKEEAGRIVKTLDPDRYQELFGVVVEEA